MSRLPARLGAALLATLASSGCFSLSGHFGAPIPQAHVVEIRDGVTTRDQIIQWFGPPSAFFKPSLLDLIFANVEDMETPSAPLVEDVYSYRYIETRVRVAIVPLLALHTRAKTRTASLTLFFDEAGVVRYHGYRYDDSDDELGAEIE